MPHDPNAGQGWLRCVIDQRESSHELSYGAIGIGVKLGFKVCDISGT